MYKLAIFDLDGTLLNTLDDLAAAANYALAEQGFPVYETFQYKSFIGRGLDNLIWDVLPQHVRSNEAAKRTKELFAEYYAIHSEDLTKPYDSVIDVLKNIKEAGIHTAIYSNKPHDSAVCLCNRYFSGLIDLLCGFKDGTKTKPDATTGFKIMEHFDVLPEETIYVGDSGVDMQTARNLGVYSVGVSWGFRPKSELMREGADVIIDKAEQLIKIVVDK